VEARRVRLEAAVSRVGAAAAGPPESIILS
jgi:hypothetical protein